MDYHKEDSIIFLDGKFVSAKEASANLFSQTVHYGYGAFEGIRSYYTINGTKIFKPYEHFGRLINSCRLLNIPFDYSLEELTQISYQILEKNNLTHAYIRPLVMAGENMTLSTPQESSLMICAWEWDKYFNHREVAVCISSYQRPNPKSTKLEAKTCGHYVNSILASNEAHQRGFDEAIMLDANGFVAEGPGANFFYEKDGVLYTPPAANILPGITRQTVLEICREIEIPVKEKLFRPEELFEADNAFFCGTATEITAIDSIEGQKLNRPWKGSLCSIVQEAFKNMVLEKSHAYVIV
ncbi:MAG: branched-chain amino acid transaminase [Bacteroidetes bacterium]|nr:branched-chain amino acid transaminase [Bacteroidota bacterium]